MCYTETLL
jgi:hypothetical protein